MARSIMSLTKMGGALAVTIFLTMLAGTYLGILHQGWFMGPIEAKANGWLQWAQIAWRYYQPGVGVNSITGLHYAVREWHRFTDWDLASYILSIIDAEKLGILQRDGTWGANYRISKIITFLQNRLLTADGLPYLVYDADTGGLPPEITPQQTNPYDGGRLLIALHHLKEHRPDLASTIDSIVYSRCNYTKLALACPTHASFYAYYVAHGFELFGFKSEPVSEALEGVQKMAGSEHLNVYGEMLPAVELTSEPLLHGLFELDLEPLFREYAYRTYRAQEKRWAATGNLTAWTEGAYDVPPYYVYEYIVVWEKTWVLYSYGVGELDISPIAYLKAAVGFHALYETSYTKTLIDVLIPQLETGQGFYEGVDETGRVIGKLTDKTNGLIINSARFALENPTLSAFPEPFVKSGFVNNTLVVIGESKPHGPCGAAHTIDTLGGMLITARLGLQASSGQLKSAMDGWLVTYNSGTGDTQLLDTASNLISVGSPGVNLVAYHYNRLKMPGEWYLLNVLFYRDITRGQNYLKVQTSGNKYYMEFDGQGRLVADYATIEICKDRHGRYVLLTYGLGAEGTRIASEILKNYDQWSLKGRAVIIRYFDSDGDGRLDRVAIVETIY